MRWKEEEEDWTKIFAGVREVREEQREIRREEKRREEKRRKDMRK